jgi:hypothetical protein
MVETLTLNCCKSGRWRYVRRRHLRALGWRGPKLMRWGEKTLHGYRRHPTVGLPAIPAYARTSDDPAAEVETMGEGTLAPELEQVTRLGLQKLARIPTDRADGNLLRAQTAAAGIAVNAQLRADETRLRQKSRGDVLERLIKIIEAEEAEPDCDGGETSTAVAGTAARRVAWGRWRGRGVRPGRAALAGHVCRLFAPACP